MSLHNFMRLSCLIAAAFVLAGCVAYEPAAYPPTSHPVPPPPSPPPAPRPPVSVNVGYFYDALEPYGDWLWVDPYGWVWAPNTVAPFWRPYTVGRWVWSDWGWTWVSSEPWGWASYHYGRWVRVKHHGWAWVPGEVWGPAWVAWRNGPGIVGWAPLPPEVRFRAGVGLDWGQLDINVAIGLDNWCFVDDLRFADDDVQRYAYPVGRNTTVFRATRDATRVHVVGGKILNEGISPSELERVTHRAIPARRVVDNPRADRRATEIGAGEIRYYRPDVHPGPPDAAPARGRKPAEPAPPPADKKVEDDADRRWDKGWNKDWDKLEKLQKRGAPAPPPAPPKPETLNNVRDENMNAAENAYRELVAERERAKRQAERKPKKDESKKDDKSKKKE
jgi:hypothetical protein